MDATPKRATIYFEPEIHRALRLKAAESVTYFFDITSSGEIRAIAE